MSHWNSRAFSNGLPNKSSCVNEGDVPIGFQSISVNFCFCCPFFGKTNLRYESGVHVMTLLIFNTRYQLFNQNQRTRHQLRRKCSGVPLGHVFHFETQIEEEEMERRRRKGVGKEERSASGGWKLEAPQAFSLLLGPQE